MNSYTFHINLFDFAALGAIFTLLNFALLLGFTKSTNRAANRLLAMALCTVVLSIAGLFGAAGWLALVAPLATGPLVYFYVRKIIRQRNTFSRVNLLHFIPMLLQPALKPPGFSVGFYQLSPAWQLAPAISISVYLFYAYRLIPRFQQDAGTNTTDRHRHELWRLRRLLARFGLLWLLWVPSAAVAYLFYHNHSGLQACYPFYLLLAVIVIWIAAIALSWPEVRPAAPVPAVLKPPSSAELSAKGSWLKNAMKAHLFYHDSELTLGTLAQKLGIHPHELSRIINTAVKKNFNDFINEYRVRDVILKMQEPAYDHITLLGMALDSGFNSKSTFNRIFKEMTGKTPAEYKQSLEKQRPTYKLRHYAAITPVVLRRETTPVWFHVQKNRNSMFRTYIKTAWRNIGANKLLATLNIAGLAIGTCVCITLFACASYELGFDRMYKNSKNIYRINLQTGAQFNNEVWAQLPGIAGPVIAQTIPQLKAVTRLLKHDFGAVVSLKTDEKNFSEKGLYMADTSIFSLFDFTFIEGNARTAFVHPKSVILSVSAKERLYGNAPAYGKVIYVDNRDTLYVSGVYQDLPQNSTLDCDMIYNIMDSWAGKNVYWGNSSYETYCLLQPGANLQQVQKLANALVNKNIAKKNRFFTGFIFQPLADIHLYSADIRAGFSTRIGSISTVKVLLLLSLLVLGIACINYMNLATARSEKRAKGVGGK